MVFFWLFVTYPKGARLEFLGLPFILSSDYKVVASSVLLSVGREEEAFVSEKPLCVCVS